MPVKCQRLLLGMGVLRDTDLLFADLFSEEPSRDLTLLLGCCSETEFKLVNWGNPINFYIHPLW